MNDPILREYHRNMLLASTFVSSDARTNRSCLTMKFARDISSSSSYAAISALIAMYEPVDDESQGIAQNVRKVGSSSSSRASSRAQKEAGGARVIVI